MSLTVAVTYSRHCAHVLGALAILTIGGSGSVLPPTLFGNPGATAASISRHCRLLHLPVFIIAPSGREVVQSLEEVVPIVDLLVGAMDLLFLLFFLSIQRYNLHG